MAGFYFLSVEPSWIARHTFSMDSRVKSMRKSVQFVLSTGKYAFQYRAISIIFYTHNTISAKWKCIHWLCLFYPVILFHFLFISSVFHRTWNSCLCHCSHSKAILDKSIYSFSWHWISDREFLCVRRVSFNSYINGRFGYTNAIRHGNKNRWCIGNAALIKMIQRKPMSFNRLSLPAMAILYSIERMSSL